MNKSFKLFLIISLLPVLAPPISAEPAGEILLDRRTVTVSSPTDAKYHVVKRILINGESGDGLGVFQVYTDAYSEISDFSGKIECGGKVIRKIKKSDIKSVNETQSLADDTFLNYYVPGATFPYIVEYDYTVTFRKGIISYPSFFPVIAYDVTVKEAEYALTAPSDIDIRYKAWMDPEIADNGASRTYSWKLNDFPGIKREHNMPEITDLLPYVRISPRDFTFLGTRGSQSSWKEVGEWLNGIMPKDAGLPEELAARVHEMTDTCGTDLGKLKVLYRYLKENTRYVSIQFGIGGFSPASPRVVHKSRYGDCKALSFFMKALLEEAGVKSQYYIVNTEIRDFPDDYPGAGVMNHAMLCVPLQSDTVWVECTNPRLPLGYRHYDIAGHQAVLVTPEGGKAVRIPSYDDSLRVEDCITDVVLRQDGSASVKMNRIFRIGDAEQYMLFRELDAEDATGILARHLAVPSDNRKVLEVTDNFQEYSGAPGYFPETSICWSFDSGRFANMMADRMLVPVNIYKGIFESQKATRIHDLVFLTTYTERNITSITIPEGYSVEQFPTVPALHSEFADYVLDFKSEGNRVIVTSVLTVKASKVPASSYDTYRKFVKAFNNAAQTNIILKKV